MFAHVLCSSFMIPLCEGAVTNPIIVLINTIIIIGKQDTRHEKGMGTVIGMSISTTREVRAEGGGKSKQARDKACKRHGRGSCHERIHDCRGEGGEQEQARKTTRQEKGMDFVIGMSASTMWALVDGSL